MGVCVCARALAMVGVAGLPFPVFGSSGYDGEQ